jgi:hypothetical protein
LISVAKLGLEVTLLSENDAPMQ